MILHVWGALVLQPIYIYWSKSLQSDLDARGEWAARIELSNSGVVTDVHRMSSSAQHRCIMHCNSNSRPTER